MNRFRFLIGAHSALCTALFFSQPASATLGEPATSVIKDRKVLAATQGTTTAHGSYTVQEIVSQTTTVREYVNSSGIVFAVAWNGRTHPDLTQLLGSYVSDYEQAKQRVPRKHGQRQLKVSGDQVVVQSWGHMRNLQGRAYVPALMPAGVNADEIK